MIISDSSRASEHRHRARPIARLWIGKMRRAGYFSPLALALAMLFLAASFAPVAAPGLARRAEAEVPPIDIGTCAFSASRIIQEICDQDNHLIPVLPRFEAGIIDAFLKAHQLPPEDRPLVLKYARTDVRSAMLMKIMAIIQTTATERTADEQAIYEWFQALVWENEKDLVQAAIDEYNRWSFDACNYTLDPAIAQAYNLSYSGAPFCHPDPFSLGPESPDKNYFLAVGLKDSYGAGLTTDPRGPAITAATARGIAFYAALPLAGLAAAVAAAFGTTVLVSSGVAASVFPFAVTAGTLTGVAAAAVASAVLIVLLAVVIGVLAAIKVFSPTALNELQALRATTAAAAPDLKTFLTGVGFMKLNQTLVAETLPDFPSAEPPPGHQAGDPVFVIQPATGSPQPSETLVYRDWDNIVKTATPVGGWFVVSQTLSDGSVKREMTLSIDYQDWSGKKWTAWRVGDTFLGTKGVIDPAFTTPDFAGATIDLLSGAGAQIRVSIARPPAITSAGGTAFSIGTANSFTITTTGSTPRITLAGALPTGVTFTDKNDGTATLSGTPAVGSAGTYPLTFVATNAGGSVGQSFTLNAGTAPVFSSIPPLVFREGRAGSVTIRTTGAPPPTIRLDQRIECNLETSVCTPGGGPALASGLTFADAGDGTATISGTPAPGTGTGLVVIVTQYLSAANGNGTAVQEVSVTVKPPLAITSDSTATLALGVPGTFTVRTSGGATRLGSTGALPPGVSFTDKGDGTATLAGTPTGTRGSYPLTLTASEGDDSVTQSFTLAVESRLTALAPAKAWVGVSNSDAAGLRVDLLAEVFLKAGATLTKVGQGQLDNQPTGSSGFANAVLGTIALSPIGGSATVAAGSELQYKLSVRRACSGAGHSSGTAVLWYNGRAVDSGTARDAGSRFGATIAGGAADLFLRPALALGGSAGTAKTSVSAALTSAQPCPGRVFTPFGTWTTALP